jgi:hypothetical protein
MVGPRIRLMDERIMALNRLYARLAVEACDVRIMLPERVSRSANVGLELAGVRQMQVAHSGGEHQHIAGALERVKPEAANHRAILDFRFWILDCPLRPAPAYRVNASTFTIPDPLSRIPDPLTPNP